MPFFGQSTVQYSEAPPKDVSSSTSQTLSITAYQSNTGPRSGILGGSAYPCDDLLSSGFIGGRVGDENSNRSRRPSGNSISPMSLVA